MASDLDALLHLADAVLDARPLDWSAAVARVPMEHRALVAELQSVAGISLFHLESSIATRSASARFSHAVGEAWAPDAQLAADNRHAPVEWGPLTIVGHIGRGRFGDVYRAMDPRLDRPVALKLLRRCDDEVDDSQSVIEEGKLLARVRHPNVVTVYGAERISGRVGLWMELIEGRTLEEEVRDRGPLPWREVAQIGADLCRAVAAVHRAGLLHRDLKAQNVLREVEGRVVLADFGAGRVAASDSDEPPELAGTPLYLAPEVFAGKPATIGSDVYSLGVLLFHLVSGSYPVRGRSLADLQEAHRQDRRSTLSDACSDLPAAFVAVVDRALAVSPQERFATANDLQQALDRLVAANKTVAAPNAATNSRQMRGAVVVLCGLIALIALAAFVMRGMPLRSADAARADGTTTPQSGPAIRKIRLPSFQMGVPSHDGRFFPHFDEAGRLRLWEVATGRSLQLTDAPPADQEGGSAAISPKGDRVAYRWPLGPQGFELRLINADGTWPRVLIARQTAYEPVPMDWSRDGRDVLCWLRQKNGSADLVLVSTNGGAPRVVHTFVTEAPAHAQLSPDGRYVVTWQSPGARSPRGAVLIIGTDGAAPRVLVDDADAQVAPIWTPDGQHVIFLRASSERRGSFDAWIVRVADGRAQGDPIRLIDNVGIARLALTDRGELYRTLSTYSADVYTASIDLSGASPAGAPSRISRAEVGNHVGPSWSPDGRSMAYFTISEGDIPGAVPLRTLTIQDIRSGRARKLPLPFALLSGYTPIWSPDGRAVVVSAKDDPSDARIGFYRVDLQSGEASALVVTGNADSPPFAAFSPDGKNFLYVDPPRGIVSRRLADGAEALVVAKGTRTDIGRIAVAPDGHALAFIGGTEHQGRWSYALEVQEVTRPPRIIARAGPPMMLRLEAWTPDSRNVIYSLGHTSNPYKLLRMSASGGEPVDLRFAMIPSPSPISLNPDGRRIAYVERVVEPELWISPLTVSR